MATISPFQLDLQQLAVGIFYINLRRAGVEFPTTTRAHPSYRVQVTLVPPLALLNAQHRALFPFFVRWDIWRNVVAPLFEDGSSLVKINTGSLRNEMNRQHLLARDIEPLLLKIQQDLLNRLIENNYAPADATVTGFVEEPAPPGEPVIPAGINDGSPFQRFDT